MAEATTAQALVTLQNSVALHSDQRQTDGVNTVTNLDLINTNYNGADHGTFGRLYKSARARASRIASLDGLAFLTFALKEYGTSATIANPHRFNSAEWWHWMEDYHGDDGNFSGGSVDANVTARGWTRGGEPTLTGHKVYRLSLTPRGNAMEVGDPGSIVLSTVGGAGNTTRTVRFTNENVSTDEFDADGGTGNIVEATSLDDVSFDQLLSNPTMVHSVADGVAFATGGLSGWTLSDPTKFLGDTTNVFRTLSTAVKCATNGETMTQTPALSLSPHVAYLPAVWAKRTGGAGTDGLSITWGSKTQSLDLGTTNYTLLVPDRDVDLYPLNFDQATDGSKFTITMETAGGATITVGWAGWLAGFFVNGTWFWTLTDTTTPIVDTYATVSDSLSITGKINDAIARRFGHPVNGVWAMLPTVGSNAISDPA